MKKKYLLLSVLLCTAVLFACLNVSAVGTTFIKPITKPGLDKIIPIPSATSVPFPENVTATPFIGKPGKHTLVPYQPTAGPIPDKSTAQPQTIAPAATPGSHKPGSSLNDHIDIETSNIAPVITPAEPRINTIHAEALSSTSIRVIWEGNDDRANGYVIYRDSGWIPSAYSIEPSLIDTGLEPDTLYSYSVVYTYPAGGDNMSLGPVGASASCRTLLPAPQGLSAVATAIEFELTWDEVNNAEGYVVYRRDEAQGSFYEILRVNSAWAITVTPPDGTTYSYRVSALNQYGEGDMSSEISVSGRANLSLRAPSWLTAAPTDYANVFTLSWEPVPGADRYYIYRNRERMDYATLGPFTATEISTGPMLFDSTYEYHVRAANGARYGRDSETLTLYVSPAENPYLQAPRITEGISINSSKIKLSWTDIPIAEKYQVYQNDGLATTVTNNSCTIEGLLPKHIYDFKVRAIDANHATGPFSEAKLIETGEGLPAPHLHNVWLAGNGTVELIWVSTTYILVDNYYKIADGVVICRREDGSSTYDKKYTVDLDINYGYEEFTKQVEGILQPGKRYYYMVRQYSDQLGEGYPSEELSIKIPMLALTGLRASVLSPDRIRLDWNPVEGAVSYKISLPNASDTYYRYTDSVNEPFYVFGLDDDYGNNLTFDVSYMDAENEVSQPASVSVRIKLGAPEGVTATALDSGRVQLGWNRVEGAESYNIYRSRIPNGTYELVGHITTDTGLNANTLYFYKVAAVNGAGPGVLSNAVSVRTGTSAPQNLTAMSISSSSIRLTWNAVPGAEAYNVFRSDTSDGLHGFICQVTDYSMTDQGLAPNTHHSYKVAAVIGSREGEASAPASARTRLAAPVGLTATALDSDSVQLSWQSMNGAESYYIYRSTLQKGGFVLVGQSTADAGPNMIDAGLSANTVYYYKVAALSGEGPGDLCSAVSVRTGIAVPQNLVATPLSSSRIGLTWSAVPGADAYNVYRSDTSDGIHGFICQVTVNGITDQGLAPNTFHSYKVSAVFGSQEGEASAPASVRTNAAP